MTRSETAMNRLPDEVAGKLRATTRVLWIERMVRGLWPLWCVAALGGSLWLLGFFEALPMLWGLALAALLALLFIGSAVYAARHFSRPDQREALRRLDSGVADRAVTMLDDDLAVGKSNPETQRLWQAHRDRLARDAEKARVPDADTRLAGFDTWNLRYAALGLLIFSFGFSRVGGPERLAALLDPTPSAAEAATLVPALEAWVAPPPYTGVAPIYLTERSGERIEVPTGSVLTLRASGTNSLPSLAGLGETVFIEEAPGVYGVTETLTGPAEIDIRFGASEMGSWRFGILADKPPELRVTEAPSASAQRELTFGYAATDDYGVALVMGAIVADRSGMEDAPGELDDPIALDLPVPSNFDEDSTETIAEDLTKHPLAGSPVTMVLEAEDGAGQRAQTAPESFVLPARVFTEPMAKAIIEQRRALAWDIRDAWEVHDLLEAVTAYPDDYFTSPAAFLATSTAIKRLNYALTEDRIVDSRHEILELLWEAAMRLEEGDLDNALEQLRAAQRRLKDALERGASDEEIEQLMDDLRQAMRNYLDEMVRQAMRDQQNGQQNQQQQSQQQQAMTREDLERLLDQLEESAKSGAREQAEQMLSMLGQMLENLQMGQSQQGQGQNGQQERALQEMMRRQQDLADETFRQLQEGENGQQQNRAGQGQQQGQPQPGQQGQQGQQGQGQQGRGRQGQQPGQGQQQGQGNGQGESGQGQGGQSQQPQMGQNGRGQGQGLRGEQDGLRDELGNLLPGLSDQGGDAAEALREAERDMGAAGDDLGSGDLNSALDDQARALDRLREGAQALAEENRRAQQEGQGNQNGPGSNAEVGRNAERLDPFGRVGRTFGPDDGLGVDVPGERARNRALEIQREIRRREAERERPDSERDYLRRLQDRF